MKSNEQVSDWLKDLKAERRRGFVTKQMAFGNTGAMNALTWFLDTAPTEDDVRLKINALQVTANESFGDELATVAFSAMIAALTWVLDELQK